jgi:NAD(P)-dependent dehydrogenase (short-subunit alcohol dehydrogenase family)
LLTAEVVVPSLRAAAENEPASTTATKVARPASSLFGAGRAADRCRTGNDPKRARGLPQPLPPGHAGGRGGFVVDITGKTFVITGASSGIGLGVTRAAVARGARVVLNGRDEGRLKDVATALGAPERVALLAADIGDPATGEALCDLALERFGRLDVLVNNAGVFTPLPFEAYTEVELDTFLHTNLKGPFFATQAAVRRMRAQGGGAVVNVTSSLSLHGLAAIPCSATVTAKGGLNALTANLALELAPAGIRVNAVAPGLIRTPLHGRAHDDRYEDLAPLQPLGHVGEVDDVVEAVLYLASAPFVTGVILPVDGGSTAGHW